MSADGGPAFPVPDLHPGALQVGSNGMSLRDWFAGNETLEGCEDLPVETREALAGRPWPRLRCPGATARDRLDALAWDADWRARLKFIRADAMLRARERGVEVDGDEAWFLVQAKWCLHRYADGMLWASCEVDKRIIAAGGSTREAAIRALRAKVEGGGQ